MKALSLLLTCALLIGAVLAGSVLAGAVPAQDDAGALHFDADHPTLGTWVGTATS